MNAKHKKTLAAIMGNPSPKTLPFRDLEAMLKGMGCEIEEAEGSRVTFLFGDHSWTTHRPHPGKEARDYHIKRAREFLAKMEGKQ